MRAEPEGAGNPPGPRGASRWFFWLGSLVLGLPALAVCGLSLVGPPSAEAAVFSLAVLLAVVGGLTVPWRQDAWWGPRLGFLLALAVLGYRFVEAGRSNTLRTATGPAMSEGRWLDRLVPERDVALGGSSLLTFAGVIGEPHLLDALRDGYDRMRRAEGRVPSSVISTFLFGQGPEDHTVHTASPGGDAAPRQATVVFLHGYIGNVSLICWQVAQAANPVGLDVVCPSMHFEADWAGPDGRTIVEATIERLRARGVRRIYLAGLSAGSIGASRLAPSLDIEGLVLISGVSPAARASRVPTIVLQGDRDTMTRPEPARRYARRGGRRVRYVAYEDASHWLILSHHEAVTEALRGWLAEREGLGAIHGVR